MEEVCHFEDIAENYCDRDTNNEMDAKTNRKDNLKNHVYRWHIAPRIVFVKNKTCLRGIYPIMFLFHFGMGFLKFNFKENFSHLIIYGKLRS